jgi:hypothetical protein
MRTRKAIASVLVKIWNLDTTEAHPGDNLCVHCGSGLRSGKASIAELVADVVCACLLLTLFTLAGYAGYRWMDGTNFKLFNHPSWHEPLDDWNM